MWGRHLAGITIISPTKDRGYWMHVLQLQLDPNVSPDHGHLWFLVDISHILLGPQGASYKGKHLSVTIYACTTVKTKVDCVFVKVSLFSLTARPSSIVDDIVMEWSWRQGTSPLMIVHTRCSWIKSCFEFAIDPWLMEQKPEIWW